MSDPSDFEETVEECHQLLNEAGIEKCVYGTVCDNPQCQSKLYHRIHVLIEERDALKVIVKKQANDNS